MTGVRHGTTTAFRRQREGTLGGGTVFRTVLASWLVVGVLVSHTESAAACSCITSTVEQALASSALVAELEILEVGAPADPSDMTSQPIRMRVVRVFATRTAIRDGDEIVIQHLLCNSMPIERDSVGHRSIMFARAEGGSLTQHYCGLVLPAHLPVPYLLIQERRRWLAGRS